MASKSPAATRFAPCPRRRARRRRSAARARTARGRRSRPRAVRREETRRGYDPSRERRTVGLRDETWRSCGIAAGGYGPVSRALFAIAICATPLLAAYHASACLSQWDLSHVPFALAGAWLGALAADLVTGAVHWACDTWGDDRTRWVGAGLIHSFREHHVQPRAMLDHDWIEVNGQPAAAAAVAWLVLALPPAREWLVGHAFVAASAWTLIAMAALANQIHQWSHHPAPRPWVRRLQRAGAILSPARHARHHRAPHATDYCITGGWLNRTLDAAGFWRALERAVTRATGAAPRANTELSSIRIAARGGNR